MIHLRTCTDENIAPPGNPAEPSVNISEHFNFEMMQPLDILAESALHQTELHSLEGVSSLLDVIGSQHFTNPPPSGIRSVTPPNFLSVGAAGNMALNAQYQVGHNGIETSVIANNLSLDQQNIHQDTSNQLIEGDNANKSLEEQSRVQGGPYLPSGQEESGLDLSTKGVIYPAQIPREIPSSGEPAQNGENAANGVIESIDTSDVKPRASADLLTKEWLQLG